MKTLIFDIFGNFGHFRASDTTRENISYPFPPRTAILGLIGAILGLERNSYWGIDSPFQGIKIGIELIKPIQRTSMRVNYIQTRNPISIGSFKILIPKDPFEIKFKDQRGFSMPILLNLLKDPGYRLFVHIPKEEVFSDLIFRIKNHRYCYPPYLGHANFLASIEYWGEYNLTPKKEGIYSVRTTFPKTVLKIDSEHPINPGFAIIYNVPGEMKPNPNNIQGFPILKTTYDKIFNPNVEEDITAYFLGDKVYEISSNIPFLNIKSKYIVLF